MSAVAEEGKTWGHDESYWERFVKVWCPGCVMYHRFTVEVSDNCPPRNDGSARPVWSWDGDLESPSFEPSLLCYGTAHTCEGEHPVIPCPDYENCEERTHKIINYYTAPQEDWEYGHDTPHTRDPSMGNCHSFLRNGVWDFLDDCAHNLAGQKVPLPPLPKGGFGL